MVTRSARARDPRCATVYSVPAKGVAHIVPVELGARTQAVAAALLDAGVLAPGVRYPTVARGTERIRLTVSAEHTAEQIDRCVEALGTLSP